MSWNMFRTQGGHGIGYSEPQNLESFYCTLCDSQMNSADIWESHITGKRHLKNQEKERQLVGMHSDKSPGSSRQSNALIPVDDPDRSKSDFYCRVCDSHMNSEQMWESHVSGKRHLKNVSKVPGEKISKLKAFKVDTTARLERELEGLEGPFIGLEFMEELVRAQRHLEPAYTCYLCNAYLQKSVVIDHIESVKHKMAFLKERSPSEYDMLKSMDFRKESIEALVENAVLRHELNSGRGRMEVKLEKMKNSVFAAQNYLRQTDPQLLARLSPSGTRHMIDMRKPVLAIEAPKPAKEPSAPKTSVPTLLKKQLPVLKSPPPEKERTKTGAPLVKLTSDGKAAVIDTQEFASLTPYESSFFRSDSCYTNSEETTQSYAKTDLPIVESVDEVVPIVSQSAGLDTPASQHYQQYVPPSTSQVITMQPSVPYNYPGMFIPQGPMIMPPYCMFPNQIVMAPQVHVQVMTQPPPPPPALLNMADYSSSLSTPRQSCVIQELNDDDDNKPEVNHAAYPSSSVEKDSSEKNNKSNNLCDRLSTPNGEVSEKKVENVVANVIETNVVSNLPIRDNNHSEQEASRQSEKTAEVETKEVSNAPSSEKTRQSEKTGNVLEDMFTEISENVKTDLKKKEELKKVVTVVSEHVQNELNKKRKKLKELKKSCSQSQETKIILERIDRGIGRGTHLEESHRKLLPSIRKPSKEDEGNVSDVAEAVVKKTSPPVKSASRSVGRNEPEKNNVHDSSPEEGEVLEIRPIQSVNSRRKKRLHKRLHAKAEAPKSSSNDLTAKEMLVDFIQKEIAKHPMPADMLDCCKRNQDADKHELRGISKAAQAEDIHMAEESMAIVKEIFTSNLRVVMHPSKNKKLVEYQCSACQLLGMKHCEDQCPLFKSLEIPPVPVKRRKITAVAESAASAAESSGLRCLKCFQLGHVYPDKKCIMYKQHLSELYADSELRQPEKNNKKKAVHSDGFAQLSKMLCSECLDQGHTQNDPICIYYTDSEASVEKDPVNFQEVIKVMKKQELKSTSQEDLGTACSVCNLTGHTNGDPACLYYEKGAKECVKRAAEASSDESTGGTKGRKKRSI